MRKNRKNRYLAGAMAAVLAAGTLTACSSATGSDVPKNSMANHQEEKPSEGKTYEALSVAERAAIDLEAGGYAAVADFTDTTAAPLYQAAKEDGAKNFLYSPTSLYLALAILAECEKPDTEGTKELYELLGVSGSEELVELTNKLTASLLSSGDGDTCWIGNSLWTDEDYAWREDAGTVWKSLEEKFAMEHFELDLNSEEAGIKKNKWVSENTNGLLGNDTPQPWTAETRIVIMNALYFDKNWRYPFEAAYTNERTFTTAEGNEIVCQMMHRDRGHHAYLQTDTYLASALEYEDGSYMLFMLPQEGISPEELLTSDLTDAVERYRKGETEQADIVYFAVPKLDYKITLKKIQEQLMELGLLNAIQFPVFDHVTENTLEVKSITQDACIQVDELGTKAAAVTEVVAGDGAAMYETIIDLNLNRPYAYAIVSANGTILFTGVVNDPTAE